VVDEEPRRVRRSRQAHAGGARATRISRTETAVPESGCLAAARGAERGRGVQRESLPRTASGPIVQRAPAGQCDHFRPPARSLGQPIPKGELGSRTGFTDHRRIPGPTAVGSAAGPGRKLPAQENAAAGKERRREARAFAASWVVNGFPESDAGLPWTLAGRDVQNSAPGRTGQDQSGRLFFRR